MEGFGAAKRQPEAAKSIKTVIYSWLEVIKSRAGRKDKEGGWKTVTRLPSSLSVPIWGLKRNQSARSPAVPPMEKMICKRID